MLVAVPYCGKDLSLPFEPTTTQSQNSTRLPRSSTLLGTVIGQLRTSLRAVHAKSTENTTLRNNIPDAMYSIMLAQAHQ